MTTIEELKAIIIDLQTKTNQLEGASRSLNTFVRSVLSLISDTNPFRDTINIDQLITLQTPIYLEKLTAVEVAADVLGTDALN